MKKLIAGAEKLGFPLDREQVRRFEVYCRELLDWNERINLTSITDYDEIQVRHFLDSLSIIPVLDRSRGYENLSVIDIGTGAGLPGLPLKLVLPDIKLTLLEATGKKAEFLRHVTDVLGMPDVEVLPERAEDAAHRDGYRAGFNTVISRAVSSLSVLAELTLPFCIMGGMVIAPKKGDIRGEVEASLKAIDTLGGSLREVRMVNIEELNDDRYMVIIDKISPTPGKYPRRPGIPEKRPL